ncbi:hypothetical protein MMC30_009344 [Trapelia coarctata]|nr:hypothetical protein [Trapelia coarctata]
MPPSLVNGSTESLQPSPKTDVTSSTGPMTPETDSNSDNDTNMAGGFEDLNRTFELKNISHLPSHSNDAEPIYHDSPENRDSFDEQRGQGGENGRKDSFMLYTPDEERAVIKRLDRRLVLFMAFLYLLSFLDRSNIGNAKVAGLSYDLGLSSSQYEWLLTAFYITYIGFQWMTLLYRVIPAHAYIAVCVISWGLIASLQSLAGSFASMLILRGLLGMAEAAFSPGVPFYLSFFFKREELALRTGLFISAAPLATSLASSLAWLIMKAGERVPISAWRLLFVIEGFPSIIVAVFAFYYLPDGPGTAKFLTRRQKKVARLRLRNEKDAKQMFSHGSKLNFREIFQTFLDPKLYITALCFFSANVAYASLPIHLPTIVNEMGYTALMSQALSAPPYLIAFVFVLATAYLSDRYRSRSVFVCISALMGASGYLIIAIAGKREMSAGWRYAGVYPAAAGFFSAVTLLITWTLNNQESDSKKGTGLATLNIIGQFGPLLGTRLYPDSDKPYYVRGMSVCAGFMLLVFLLSLILRVILIRENSKSTATYSLAASQDDEEELVDKEVLGARPVRFKYMT